ncbi:MAG TPA: hypothetical protein VFB06_37155 [Streptosporangiaceae bacterium]|nr:hypothetical protein [Streptosporangiaceae bacterium]
MSVRWAAGLAAVAVAVTAVVSAALPACANAETPTTTAAPAASASHVVIVGIPGLRWSDVSAQATPALYQLAGQGSVGTLVEYARLPHSCPADGWLVLNAGARAQVGHKESGPCPQLPAVNPRLSDVASMPAIVDYNKKFSYNPVWGTLAAAAPGAALAVGPGAALALAKPDGSVGGDYLNDPATLTAADLASHRLTAIDLGALPASPAQTRQAAVRAADAELHAVLTKVPEGTTVLVASPGALDKAQLGVVIVSGPGYEKGLLHARSTHQPGMVVITDLTPTVLRWLGATIPAGVDGTQLTRTGRPDSLTATITGFTGRQTAERVWTSTHSIFFWTYALADVAALGVIGLAFWGATTERRRRRVAGWRVAGVFAVAAPAGTFLANLVPWWQYAHPALWEYAMSVAWTAVIGLVALRGPWRRDPLGPFGAVSLFTLVVLALDVMTGSRLELESPFGLSVLEAGRFYGIGNEALGIYGMAALCAATWLGIWGLRSHSKRVGLVLVCVVGALAVVVSGWPGFGAKVGGTIAMVPCFALLLMILAGIRLNWRRIALVAVSGLALFAVFALINYAFPITGTSDISSFTGNTLHGHGNGLLNRKIASNIGSLTVNAYSPVVPVTVILAGLMLWRPSWFRLSTAPRAYRAEPLLQAILGVLWLMPVLGWFADDSGVIVAAAALPFGLPLGIALLSAAAYQDLTAGYLGSAAAGAGSSVAGQTVSAPDR